jgi:hypothetical protein
LTILRPVSSSIVSVRRSVISFSKSWRNSRTWSAFPNSSIVFSAVVMPPRMTMISMSSSK